MKKLFYIIPILFCTFTSIAQSTSTTNTDKIFGKEKEIYFRFDISNRDEISALTKIVSIANVKDNSVYAYANPTEFAAFLNLGKLYEILPYPRIKNPKMLHKSNIGKQIGVLTSYPTYSAYETLMANYASNYPTLCDLDTILAQTPMGNHRILVLKISDNINSDENEPEFLYTSSMHGNELTGYPLMLDLIDLLLTSYGNNSRITNIVNNCEIWINPLANPDGTFPSGDNTIGNATRYNDNGVDLNRNYPDFLGGSITPIQPETQAFMDFAANHDFNISANFHDGAEVVNYPWDTKPALSADNSWWVRHSRIWADTVHVNAGALGAGYFTDLNNGITNGFAWYEVDGGRMDYMNYYEHCRETTIEISISQPPSASLLDDYWYAQVHSFLKYLEESLNGIRGIVTDSCSGQAMIAKVYVNGHEINSDSSFVYSSLPVGNYHRYLINGTYSVTYSAPGYQSKTFNNLVVTNGNPTVQNVVLKPGATPNADFVADVTSTCSGEVNFTDYSAGGVISWSWNFGDGGTSSIQNPSHTYTSSGVYTVRLSVTNCLGIDSIVRTSYINVTLVNPYNLVNDTSCGPGVLTLGAQSIGSVDWYSSPVGGSSIWTGTSYTTPLLNISTTYYTEGVLSNPQQSAAKPNNSGGGGNTSSGDHYLIFDCYDAVILESMTVYTNTNTTKTFQLRTSGGTVLESASILLANGTNNVVLNWNIPVGTDLQLACTSGSGVYRNNAGVSYPYTLAGVISVKNSCEGPTYYYYSYDWKVRKPACISSREPVYAVVETAPTANFSGSQVGSTVNLTNLSVNATSYFWDFGDGTNSTSTSPSHTYTANGTYYITLYAYGCVTDSITISYTVTTVGLLSADDFGSLRIWPNPSSSIINLDLGNTALSDLNIEIFDVQGNLIIGSSYKVIIGIITIDINALSQGIYFIRLTSPQEVVYYKIFKSEL